MPETVKYKGFIIQAVPTQEVDTGRWKTYLQIQRDDGLGLSSRGFHAAPTYETREEAIIGCLQVGKLIIDGKLPDLTKELP